jgi:hypothetical protein
MLHLLAFFARIFEPTSRTTELEKYIVARDPQSIAEVERIIKDFDESAGGRRLWWI